MIYTYPDTELNYAFTFGENASLSCNAKFGLIVIIFFFLVVFHVY